MRIVHVEAGRYLYGGAQQVAYLMQGLARLGHDQVLVCPPDAAIAQAAKDCGIEAWEIGPDGDLDIGFVRRLTQRLSGWRADLIHLHSRRGADSLGLVAARRAGLPVVLSRRVDNPENNFLVRWRYRRCDRVIAISNGIARVLREQGVPDSVLRVVHSTVPSAEQARLLDRQTARARLGLAPGLIVAGMAAQLIQRKGHVIAFEALQQMAVRPEGFQLLVFGRGPLEQELRADVQRRGLDGLVRFMGFRDDLDELWPALDLLVHPALMEGLGVALLKAQAAGVPVVASAAGGIPEAIENGRSGLLVPPGDVEALREALQSLVDNVALRQRLAGRAPQWIEEQFSVEAMVRGNLAVYAELVPGASKV